jgi:hypothetical protein
MQMDGESPVELIQKSQTEFVKKGANVQIRFEQDGGGQTTAVEFHYGAVESIALRLDAEGVAAHKAAVAAQRARVESHTPDPRSEATVRDFIAGITTGKPNYSAMNEQLADTIRRQLPLLQRRFVSLGPLLSVRFLGVDTKAADHYEARYRGGKSRFAILFAPNGLIGIQERICWFSDSPLEQEVGPGARPAICR